MEDKGSVWELSSFPGPEWAGQSPSTPLLLLQGPSNLPLLISWPPSYAPRTHVAWMGLWRGGTGLGAQQAPRPEWARRLPSAPLLLLLDGPSRLPLLISLASLLCPQDPRGLEGALVGDYQPGSSTGSPAPVGGAIAVHSPPALPGESLPPASPDLPGLRGTNPVWPPFLLPPSPPMSYQFTWGFLPSPWASGSHTSSRQAP